MEEAEREREAPDLVLVLDLDLDLVRCLEPLKLRRVLSLELDPPLILPKHLDLVWLGNTSRIASRTGGGRAATILCIHAYVTQLLYHIKKKKEERRK